MKEKIHPAYYPDAKVVCSCGATWTTGSTRKQIHTEVCSNCHPFFTGQQQRVIDVEGRVDRFYRKLQARQSYVDQQKTRDDERTSLDRPVESLELGTRTTEVLTKAGITKVAQVMEKLVAGQETLLAIDGFGRKSLIDLKKRLRQFGYELPAGAEEVTV